MQNKSKDFLHNETLIILLISFLYFFLLLFEINDISISYYEASIFYNKTDLFTYYISNLSVFFFGQNAYALRLPFLFIQIANLFLLYKISKPILRKRSDRYLAAILYLMLPGVLASSILVNPAVFIIFITLLIVYFEQNKMTLAFYALLLFALFVGREFVILYLALFFYYLQKRDKAQMLISLLLIVAIFTLYNFDASGKPKGYFLDTLGIFAAVFSPLIFLYYFYSLYRCFIKSSYSLLWFIATTGILLSLLLSFRQKLSMEEILPFCVIATPLMVMSFFSSYRSRLPRFRNNYKTLAFLSLFILFLSSSAIFYSDLLYSVLFLKKPSSHFIYDYNIAKELANYLKSENIHKICSNDKKMSLRLRFYNIEAVNQNCDKNLAKLIKTDIIQKNSDFFILKRYNTTIVSYVISIDRGEK